MMFGTTFKKGIGELSLTSNSGVPYFVHPFTMTRANSRTPASTDGILRENEDARFTNMTNDVPRV
jgi:hypothetical protein